MGNWPVLKVRVESVYELAFSNLLITADMYLFFIALERVIF